MAQQIINIGTAPNDGTGDNLRAAFDKTNDNFTELYDNKSDEGHTHPISEVTGLQAALDSKAGTAHSHIIGDVTGLQAAIDGKSAVGHTHVIADTTGLQAALDSKAATTHGHVIGDVTSLQTTLDGKAAVSHSHAIADVTNLQTTLDGKALASHAHAIADVTNLQATLDGKEGIITAGTTAQYYRGDKTFQTLNKAAVGLANVDNTSDASKPISTATQTALDGKSNTGHAHAISDVTGLSAALAGKSDTGHTHAISDTTGLQAALDSKAASSHGHAISDVTGLQGALDGKSATGHTHTLSAITDAGTAASRNVPASGDASATEVVKGNDTRLSDARTPTAHSHVIADVTGLQTALDGKAATGHTHSDATTSVAGFMSATDKTKLDGIETGATGDMTASEIRDALQGLAGANRLDASAIKNLPGGATTIAGTISPNFGTSGDTLTVNVANANVTLTNILSFTVIPLTSTDHPDLEDWALEGMRTNIENVVDNTGFDVRFTAAWNTFGQYNARYILQYQ